MAYIGIDFGSRAIKAGLVDPTISPQPLALGPLKYIPNLCGVMGNEGIDKAQANLEKAFRGEPTDPQVFVPYLRDQAIKVSDNAKAQRRLIGAVDVHRWPLAALRRALTPLASQVEGVVVSIPDSWRNSQLALPVAMAFEQLTPLALVPESLAALVGDAKFKPGERILAISMGAGSARLSLVECEDDRLTILQTWEIETLGGRSIRTAVRDVFANQVALRTRKLVVEDRAAAQELDSWIDRCMTSIATKGSHDEPLQVYGQSLLARSFTVGDLVQMLSQDGLAELKTTLQSVFDSSRSPHQVVIWGEGSTLARNLLASQLAQSIPVHIAKLDSVALGCAAIAQDLATGQRGYFEENTPILRTSDGGRTMRANLTADVVPILHPLHQPNSLKRSAPQAHLDLLNGSTASSIPLSSKPMRIGRDPRSEVVIDSDRFPTVSSAHAVVLSNADGHLLRDLGSSNGTYINGKRITEAKLTSGDRIRLGASGPEFLFRLESNS